MELIDRSKLSVVSIDITDLPIDKGLMCYLAEDVDNAPIIQAIPLDQAIQITDEWEYRKYCIEYVKDNVECVNYRDYIIEQLKENEKLKIKLEYKAEVIGDLETENKQLKEKIYNLGNDIRAVNRQSMSEECLVGFNMALALTNKHLGKGEGYEY